GNGTWDSSGNGHHLTWSFEQPTPASGVTADDAAIVFPLGVGEPADPNPLGNLVGDLTIEGWLNSGSEIDGYTLIKAEGANKAYEVGYEPFGGGTVFFEADWDPAGIEITFVEGGWVHFAFTLEWSGNNYSLASYLNGNLFDTRNGTA